MATKRHPDAFADLEPTDRVTHHSNTFIQIDQRYGVRDERLKLGAGRTNDLGNGIHASRPRTREESHGITSATGAEGPWIILYIGARVASLVGVFTTFTRGPETIGGRVQCSVL